MSSLLNTTPQIAGPTTQDRLPPRSDDTARARDDDNRFSDRLERETSRSDASRSDRARDDTRSEPSRNESSRSEFSRSETDRSEKSESAAADAVSQTTSTDEQVDSDDSSNQETSAATPSDEPKAEETDLSLDAALAFLSEAEATETSELTITTRSGETISLTPPATAPNGQTEPGSLSRWFVEASGTATTSLTGAGTQMAGLLAKTGTGTSLGSGEAPDLASLIGQVGQNGQKAASPALDGTALSSGQATSFADAMASANNTAESMDAMMSQAMAKAATALEAGTIATAPATPGPTVATGAQPTMTAVPQGTAGQAVPVAALAVEINRQAMNGKTQFEIRLDPPELGRLNVKLEVDSNGQTRTHLVVERGETLDMLTTDSRSLERALQQAGLKAEPGSVTFELAQDFNDGLAQNGNQSEAGDNDTASPDGTQTGDDDVIPELTDMSSVEAVRQQLYLTGHLDVRV